MAEPIGYWVRFSGNVGKLHKSLHIIRIYDDAEGHVLHIVAHCAQRHFHPIDYENRERLLFVDTLAELPAKLDDWQKARLCRQCLAAAKKGSTP